MAKRKNLRNPDILPFDYVSILLNWRVNTLSANNPTLTVTKVLKGTFPFNANILSTIAVDNSSTISFVFQSPFDINTSPWQFELEAALIASNFKVRPTAVYNGSNNQITIKFNAGSLSGNTSYPVVFTAKRYRPTTQYLAQLATAAQTPVTIQGGASIELSTLVPNATNIQSNIAIGFYFTAASTYTITFLSPYSVPFNAISWNVKVYKINAPLDTANYTILYEGINLPVSGIAVSIPITNGDVIGVLSTFVTNVGGIICQINSNAGFNIGFYIAQGFFNTFSAPFQAYTGVAGTTKIFYNGASTWSNLIY